MVTRRQWTTADLAELPLDSRDGKRYEIIDGELYMCPRNRMWYRRVARTVGGAHTTWRSPRPLPLCSLRNVTAVCRTGVLRSRRGRADGDVLCYRHRRCCRSGPAPPTLRRSTDYSAGVCSLATGWLPGCSRPRAKSPVVVASWAIEIVRRRYIRSSRRYHSVSGRYSPTPCWA